MCRPCSRAHCRCCPCSRSCCCCRGPAPSQRHCLGCGCPASLDVDRPPPTTSPTHQPRSSTTPKLCPAPVASLQPQPSVQQPPNQLVANVLQHVHQPRQAGLVPALCCVRLCCRPAGCQQHFCLCVGDCCLRFRRPQPHHRLSSSARDQHAVRMDLGVRAGGRTKGPDRGDTPRVSTTGQKTPRAAATTAAARVAATAAPMATLHDADGTRPFATAGLWVRAALTLIQPRCSTHTPGHPSDNPPHPPPALSPARAAAPWALPSRR